MLGLKATGLGYPVLSLSKKNSHIKLIIGSILKVSILCNSFFLFTFIEINQKIQQFPISTYDPESSPMRKST